MSSTVGGCSGKYIFGLPAARSGAAWRVARSLSQPEECIVCAETVAMASGTGPLLCTEDLLQAFEQDLEAPDLL